MQELHDELLALTCPIQQGDEVENFELPVSLNSFDAGKGVVHAADAFVLKSLMLNCVALAGKKKKNKKIVKLEKE